MKATSTTLVFFSPTGASAKIARGIASGIPLPVKEWNLTHSKLRGEKKLFSQTDLVIFAFPVYGGRLPPLVQKAVKNISANQCPAILAVTYGNRHYDDALLELKKLSLDHGFHPIAAAAFIGEHSYTRNVAEGRPDANDILLARDFGRESFRPLEKSDKLPLPPQIPGHFPYVKQPLELHLPPSVDENCDGCQICVEACPTDAINSQNPKEVDPAKCISCCCCIKICPNGARHMRHERILQSVRFLEEHCAIPRTAEFFYPGNSQALS